MRELVHIFQYIQKYYEDNFDVLYLVLEFLLVCQNTKLKNTLLKTGKKEALDDFYAHLHSLGLEVLKCDARLNYKKILKTLQNVQITQQTLEGFIQTIALQKTILKLYDYATPAEINGLVRGLLDLQKDESIYNPCCGIGTWLVSLGTHHKDCRFYGVDINQKLIKIAKSITLLLGFKNCFLEVADIFKQPLKPNENEKFDKVFCHPPLLHHLNLKASKDSPLAPYIKTAPEIPFLDYALMRFRKKAVFIIRTSLLSKGFQRFRSYLAESKLLESIIELPTNIFPYQTEEFCLLIVSHNNKRVFFINAKDFYLKEGKYHKIINLEEILDLYFSKQDTRFSRLLEYKDIALENFKPSFYLESKQGGTEVLLDSFLETSYRGSRVESKNDSDLVECYDFGIKDFTPYGFSDNFCERAFKSNQKKIHNLKIQPYDVLLSMRGVIPRFTIIGKSAESKIVLPNAGILVLRFKDSDVAKAVYLYFYSKEGQESLSRIYALHHERISEKEIKEMSIPKEFLEPQFLQRNAKTFNAVCKLGQEIAKKEEEMKSLLHS